MAYVNDVFGINRIWRKPGDLDDLKPGDRPIWWGQEEMLKACVRAIKERKPIYVATGHSLGKDFLFGTVGPWFLQTRIPSLVALTGPTDRQVNDIMWKETRSHWDRRKIDLGGKAYTEPRIEIEKDWYLIGFTTKETTGSKDAGGAKFQGIKGKSNVCVIVTEAQAVEDNIYDQIDAITTSENVLVIFLGNPTRAKGRFAKGISDRKNNIVLSYSCLQSPNYIEGKEVIPGLVGKAWVEDKRVKWGEDDPRWVGRVLGEVPDAAMTAIFTPSVIEHGKSRWGFIAGHSFNRGVAWDPAGEGSDPHVFYSGSNGEVMDKFQKTLMSPDEGAIKAVQMCKAIMGSWIIVDCDGVGQRDAAALKALPEDYLAGIQIIEFHGSAPSTSHVEVQTPNGYKKKAMYKNVRAEAAFIARDRITAGKGSINPKDTELIEELECDSWIPDKPMIQIIEKEDVKEMLDPPRSPGSADAFKMFQYACEQNFKELVYNKKGQLPQSYSTDQDLNVATMPQSYSLG